MMTVKSWAWSNKRMYLSRVDIETISRYKRLLKSMTGNRCPVYKYGKDERGTYINIK